MPPRFAPHAFIPIYDSSDNLLFVNNLVLCYIDCDLIILAFGVLQLSTTPPLGRPLHHPTHLYSRRLKVKTRLGMCDRKSISKQCISR